MNEGPRQVEKTEEVDTDALTRSAGRGALWQVAGGGWQTVIRLGASTVLARVLFPEDFGILGMALLARSLIQRIGALGTGAGLIAKKDATQDDLSTAFWMGAAVQIFLFLVAIAAAPLAAIFFKTPAITWVMRVISITFLFSAVAAVSSTLLTKRLRFGGLTIINGAGVALESGLAIIFVVVFDLGYWALVSAMLISSFAMTVARVVYARWLPSFRFNRASFRYLFRYGINGLGASTVSFFHQNIDYLLVGRLLGTATLGFYEFAYRIPHLIYDRLAGPVGSVVFPTLSKVQTSDERLAAGYVKAVKYIALIVFPMLGGLAVVARPAVAVLWGHKWLPIVIPLQILCVSAAMRCVFAPIGAVFMCKDRPDILFKFGLVRLTFTFAVVGCLGYALGLVGIALGMVLSTLPAFYLLHIALRLMKASWGLFFSALRFPVAISCATVASAGVARWALESHGFGDPVVMACSAGVGIIFLLMTSVVVFPASSREVLQTIREIVGNRKLR